MLTLLFFLNKGTHLGDPVLPAHPPEARGSQDDGGEVLLLVQLLQASVEVPPLGAEGLRKKKKKKNAPRFHAGFATADFKDTMSLNSRCGNLFFS